MKKVELLRLNLKTIHRIRVLWHPFMQILCCAGFLISKLLSMKTAYYRLNELGTGNITCSADAINYFSNPAQLQEGKKLDDEKEFEIMYLWATTGKTGEESAQCHIVSWI